VNTRKPELPEPITRYIPGACSLGPISIVGFTNKLISCQVAPNARIQQRGPSGPVHKGNAQAASWKLGKFARPIIREEEGDQQMFR
jgi:hypothetical protein